jgi:hypothetical protein
MRAMTVPNTLQEREAVSAWVTRARDRGDSAGASHLHHAFTKCYGCTPAAYRKQAQP